MSIDELQGRVREALERTGTLPDPDLGEGWEAYSEALGEVLGLSREMGRSGDHGNLAVALAERGEVLLGRLVGLVGEPSLHRDRGG